MSEEEYKVKATVAKEANKPSIINCLKISHHHSQNTQGCKYKCGSLEDMAKHYADDHPNYKKRKMALLIQCPICFESDFKSDSYLISHWIDAHRKFQCPHCPKSCRANRKLLIHIQKMHSATPRHKCPQCDEMFFSYPLVKKHVHEFHQQKPLFKCDYCPAELKTKIYKRVHEKTQHPDLAPKNLFKIRKKHCEICDKTFSIPSLLKRHNERIHQKLKKAFCDKCGNSFHDAQHLQRHTESVHIAAKSHKCHMCDRGFNQKTQLTRHIQDVHEGIKRFQCQSCGKEFAQAGNLRTHLSKHHGILEKAK